MRKRDKARQWVAEAAVPKEEISPVWGTIHKCNYLSGDNRDPSQRLKQVQIGEWLKVTLIEPVKGREQYRVQFGDDVYVVSIMDDGHPSINLAWADSFVNAKPENIGQLNNTTAVGKKKSKG